MIYTSYGIYWRCTSGCTSSPSKASICSFICGRCPRARSWRRNDLGPCLTEEWIMIVAWRCENKYAINRHTCDIAHDTLGSSRDAGCPGVSSQRINVWELIKLAGRGVKIILICESFKISCAICLYHARIKLHREIDSLCFYKFSWRQVVAMVRQAICLYPHINSSCWLITCNTQFPNPGTIYRAAVRTYRLLTRYCLISERWVPLCRGLWGRSTCAPK